MCIIKSDFNSEQKAEKTNKWNKSKHLYRLSDANKVSIFILM